MSSPLLPDIHSEVVPGVYVLHSVFCQYRNLPDLRRADQENPTSICVPARLLQVSKYPSLTSVASHNSLRYKVYRTNSVFAVLTITLGLILDSYNYQQNEKDRKEKAQYSNLKVLIHCSKLVIASHNTQSH